MSSIRHKRTRRRNDSDDSDENSLTEDLDQIGRLGNLNLINLNLSSYIGAMPMPNMPNMPHLNLPNLPTLRNLPNLPNLPNLAFDIRLQEFSTDFSNYLLNFLKDDENGPVHERLANSIKTSVLSRVQMNNILSDLNLGFSITAAIDRLQPLRDIINETILLPVDDSTDEEGKTDVEVTEPVGVRRIVHEAAPLITEIVKPDIKRRHHRKFLLEPTNDDSSVASDLDIVQGLSVEEVKALTDLDSLADFTKEELLRKKIQTIQGLTELLQELKNKLVTRLMMGNYLKYLNGLESIPSMKKLLLVTPEGSKEEQENEQKSVLVSAEIPELPPSTEQQNTELSSKDTDMSSDDEVMLNDIDTLPSYHDPPYNTILGCSHYMRNCKLECPTCQEWHPCRFCHDAAVTTHKLVRNDVKHILCMHCNTPQVPDQLYCVNCEVELAHYFCEKCKLYDNDPKKDIYHCDGCGMCRLGLGLDKDYFHCDECGICLLIDLRERHRCLTNTTHSDCPICNEYMFTLIHKVVFMKCGHSIHEHCYEELVKHSYKCPMCKKTIVNVETQFRILDLEIVQSPLPLPYNFWRCIVSCNDCNGKSNVPYHVLGLKCKYCKSYNTNQISLIKPEEEEEEETPALELRLNSSIDLSAMRLVETNLLSNFIIDEQQDAQQYADDADNENEDDLEVLDLTQALGRNPSGLSVSYIASIFQNFINKAGQ